MRRELGLGHHVQPVHRRRVARHRFVVHGQVVDEGRLTPLQAKRFTEAATGAREVTRTEVDLSRVVRRATT